MLSWNYFCRRKRLNVDAWLDANGLTTYAALRKHLLGLGVEPPSFEDSPVQNEAPPPVVKKYDPRLDPGLLRPDPLPSRKPPEVPVSPPTPDPLPAAKLKATSPKPKKPKSAVKKTATSVSKTKKTSAKRSTAAKKATGTSATTKKTS